MNLMKVAIASILAGAPIAAPAAIRYEFSALTVPFSSAGLGTFSYTADNFITLNMTVFSGSFDSCSVSSPGTSSCNFAAFFADSRALTMPSGADNFDAINFSSITPSGNPQAAYYFRNNAFGSVGVYSTLFGSSATLRVSEVFENGAVPEPTTWAMFIAGFGMIGGALRRRQKMRRAEARSSAAFT
jgi:hypothetical protein